MARLCFNGVILLASLLAGIVAPVSGWPAEPGAVAPEIVGGPWLNSEPLTLSALRGRVILLEFWTYG